MIFLPLLFGFPKAERAAADRAERRCDVGQRGFNVQRFGTYC